MASSSVIGTNYRAALPAAIAAASSQHWPASALYMVATPIGNLADISLRALYALHMADAIACEDTRHTAHLLQQYGIAASSARLLALHQHNEQAAAQTVLARLQQGQRLVYVSDAGTPAISDPGARLAAVVQAAGLRVIPVPGASSVTAALSVAGLEPAAHSNGIAGLATGWIFAGFLPTRAQERSHAVSALHSECRAVVVLEAPHRMAELAQALAICGTRPVTLAREITKQHETIATLPACELAQWLAAAPERIRGEFVLVLHPQPAADAVSAGTQSPSGLTAHQQRVLHLLLEEGLPTKSAARLAAEIADAPRNALYAAALQWKAAQQD